MKKIILSLGILLVGIVLLIPKSIEAVMPETVLLEAVIKQNGNLITGRKTINLKLYDGADYQEWENTQTVTFNAGRVRVELEVPRTHWGLEAPNIHLVIEGDEENVITIPVYAQFYALKAKESEGVFYKIVSESAATSPDSTIIDWSASARQRRNLSDSAHFEFIDPVGPTELKLVLVHQNGNAKTVSWPADVYWAGGIKPTLSEAEGVADIITLYYDGSLYYGSALLDFSAGSE